MGYFHAGIYHPGIDVSTAPSTIEKQTFLDELFGRIARRYDFVNFIQSVGLDAVARRRAARFLNGDFVLDVGAGSGDFSRACLRGGASRAVLLDRSGEMLAIAKRKLREEETAARVYFIRADARRLPFKDGVFDGVGHAFFYRNLPDARAILRGIRRVVRNGGDFVALDMYEPPKGIWGSLFKFYMRMCMPLFGALFASDRAAYRYLVRSVETCFPAAAMAAWLKDAGFDGVRVKKLFGGAAGIVSGVAHG